MKQLLGLLKGLLVPLAAVAALLCFATAVGGISEGHDEESLRQLEEAVRHGCVACYAAEGVYPPTLEYLSERYGVQIDNKRYYVAYTVVAENLMPDITVLHSAEAAS